METKSKKQTVKTKKQNKIEEPKPKSRTRLYWDDYLGGVKGEILDMRAVLK
jgi:hypothetical protein